MSQVELPQQNDESLSVILAEMDALEAVFDANFRNGSRDRAEALLRYALNIRPPQRTVEDRLTVVAMSHCLGIQRSDLALVEPPKKGGWRVKTFNTIATSWMRWVTATEKRSPLLMKDTMQGGDQATDREAETLSLNFWAQALELFTQGRLAEAQKFFERATSVGSQFGTSTNPPICWTYAASFFSSNELPLVSCANPGL